MAEDRVFFRALAWVDPRTRVPVVAIVTQSVWTVLIMFFGNYEKILNYVISMDAIFWALTAGCLFILRRREPAASAFPMPGHPWTTAAFCLICTGVVANTIYHYSKDTLIGMAILASGVPLYYIWKKVSRP
jgi:APA family basic amino acid/polyamine antiporter